MAQTRSGIELHVWRSPADALEACRPRQSVERGKFRDHVEPSLKRAYILAPASIAAEALRRLGAERRLEAGLGYESPSVRNGTHTAPHVGEAAACSRSAVQDYSLPLVRLHFA